jgi:DNA-binding XRE family transcriptional regulator
MNHPDGWQGGILNRLGAFWRAISGGCDLSADGSQDDLAAEAGTRQALVSAIEIGAANPTLASLEKLAITLEVTLAELFTAW